MATSIREKAWKNFLDNKAKLEGKQNIFVKKGYISIYPERILIGAERKLGTAGAPVPGNVPAELGTVNELDMQDLERKMKSRQKGIGIFDIVAVRKMPGHGRRFHWVTNENAKPGEDVEGSVRKELNKALIDTLSTGAGNNEDVESIRARISEATPGSHGSARLEHGSRGGVGEAEDRIRAKGSVVNRVMGDFDATNKQIYGSATKETRGLKVQSNVLRSLTDALKDQGKYTDYAEAEIKNWLDQEFSLTTEMKKKTTVKGIEDEWVGRSTLTVRDKIPGTGTAANAPEVDNAVEEKFKKWTESESFEAGVAQQALAAGKEDFEKHFSASKKYQDRYMDIAVKNISDFILTKAGRPDMRFKKNKDAMKKLQATINNKAVSKSKRKRAKTKIKQPTGSNTMAGGMKAATAATMANAQSSALSLKELINAQLPGEILERMHLPALRNRTGRFRNSAEVINVTQGARGATQIDYTYMRNPYETFEPGGAQGSTHRDPRRLIGGAIRDIAMDITGRRFIRTRRL